MKPVPKIKPKAKATKLTVVKPSTIEQKVSKVPNGSTEDKKVKLTAAQKVQSLHRRMGQPTLYNETVATEICTWIAQGKSLNSYCKQPGTVNQDTVYTWLFAHPAFSEKYAKAREDQADTHADLITDIADEKRDVNEDVAAFNARQRLRVDVRKWTASKLKPKKYGDKIELGGSLTISYEAQLKALAGSDE